MMVDNLRCYDYRAEYYQTYREIEYRIKHCEEKDILFVISASGEQNRMEFLLFRLPILMKIDWLV